MDIVGRTLGKFKVDRPLGQGGIGVVYRAYDLSLQQQVAIRVIHPHLAPAGLPRALHQESSADAAPGSGRM